MGYDSTLNGSLEARVLAFDPKMVPLTILKRISEVSKSLDTQLDGATADHWYIPVNADRTPNANVQTKLFAFRTPERVLGTPGVYNFEVSKRDGSDSIEVIGTPVSYLTKVIDSSGDHDGIILPHGITDAVASDFQTILSNKYVALRMGQGEFETRVKLAIGGNQAEAQNELNKLGFWNYTTKAALDATFTVPATMGTTEWVVRESGNEDAGYDASRTTNLTFDAGGKALSVHVAGNGNTSVGRYNIVMIEESIDQTKAIFQLFGIGEWANQFIALEIPGPRPDTDYAKYGVDTSIKAARDIRDGATPLRLRDRIDILVTAQVIARLITRTESEPIVEATRHKASFSDNTVDYYDPKSFYEYSFLFGAPNPKVTIVSKIGDGDAQTQTYDMEFNASGADTEAKGYFTLKSSVTSDPLHNKIIGFDDVGDTGPFKIQVEGRTYEKLTPNGTGEIGAMAAQETKLTATGENLLWALNDTKSVIVKNNELLTELSSEPIASFSTGTGGNIQTPTGVYDPKNTMTYTFNAAANSLQVVTFETGTRTVQNYDLSIVEGTASSTYPKKGLLYAVSATGSTGHLNNKFIDVELISATNFLLAYGNTKAVANTEAIRLKNRSNAGYKYSYWTHERLRDFTDMDKRLIEKLRDLSTTEQTYYEVEDWDIAKNAVAKQATGLVMLADDRFYESRFLNNADGFFDTKDYYKFEIQTLQDSKVDYIEIKHYKDSTVSSTLRGRIRMLDDTSPTEGAFVILKGVKADGTEDTGTGSAELKDLFENSVLSIKINIDNQIMLGYNKGNNLATVKAAAKAQLTTKMTGLSQYTPNMISEHIARQQHFVPYILSGDPTRTFTDNYGLASATELSTHSSGAGFQIDNEQMTFRFTPGATDLSLGPKGRSNIYRATVKLRPATIPGLDVVNSGDEELGTDITDFMIQPLQVDSKERMIFKFHKPTDTSSVAESASKFTTAGWKKLMLDDYQAVEIGTGGNILQYKWVHGSSVADATTKLNKSPFFNGSHYWGATSKRRESLNILTGWIQPSGPPPLGGYPAHKREYTLSQVSGSSTSGDQGLFEITEPNSSRPINLTFRKIPNYEGKPAVQNPPGYNYTLQAEQNGDTIGMYELTPKDMPTPEGGITQYALGVTGMGAMNGFVIFISNKPSKDASAPENSVAGRWKMIWVKPKDGDEFSKMVRQFLQADEATGSEWHFRDRNYNLILKVS